MRIAKDDLRAAAVIRETAMRLFAGRGAAAVTVREIAAAAGVSAGLVVHHYGSKDGLKDAVDRRAVAFFEDMTGEFARLGEEGGSASLAELFAARLDSEPVMVEYIRRLLLDGGEAAGALFAKLLDATAAGMRSLTAAGVVRANPQVRVYALSRSPAPATARILPQEEATATLTAYSARHPRAWAAMKPVLQDTLGSPAGDVETRLPVIVLELGREG